MKKLTGIIPAFIVMIILLIIIPLPVWLLDTMFILNITTSVIIFLTTMYIKEALQFSVLPTLLLITTVFRIALNISSTRLILSNQGKAGKVISTFGDFVLGGNVVIGFVIFLIIVAVQFIVIVKGSERVAEVAARFTLDAMPGKQMAIDADLSAGIINDQEAIKRRQKVQREADFYGAMDGASKFVKGDAILSILVVFINIIGGICVGLIGGGHTFKEVLNIYSIATVGDGLASQLPSLMISIATGMVVTRAASNESFVKDISKQFVSQPNALVLTGSVLVGFILIPGFPKLATLMLGSLLIFLGVRLINAEKRIETEFTEASTKQAKAPTTKESDFYKNIDNVYELISVNPIELEFGYSIVSMVSSNKGNSFVDRVVMLRKQFAIEMGFVFPSVRLRDNAMLAPNQYVIKIKGEEVARGEVLIDYYLALDSGNTKGDINGIETVEPAYGIPSKWILKADREKAEALGYTTIEAMSVIITHLSEVIKHHAFELLSRKDVVDLLENVKKSGRVSTEEIIPDMISMIDLYKILSNLLKEFISIKDLETILSAIAENINVAKDPDTLTEFVRQALKRTITRTFVRDGSLVVISLSSEAEKLILSSIRKADNKTYLNIEPERISEIVNSVNEQIEKHKNMFTVPIILTSSIVRIHLSRLLEQFISNVVVLSLSEIENSVQILSIGRVFIKD